MKISEILKVLITIVKYIVIAYFILNLVAYIYFYMIQPRETPMAEKNKLAVDMLLMGNAFLYGLLSDIIQGKRLYGDKTYLPYNAV